MQLAHIYIHFLGNAEEALTYYEKVFGTKIAVLQRFGDAPWANAPESAKNKVMHGQIPITETVHLMASDAVEGLGPTVKAVGTNFQVCVVAKDKSEADRAFGLLSDGGSVQMALANAPWGPYFGMCTDKFGVRWMVSLPTPA
jgi:PhnB protein